MSHQLTDKDREIVRGLSDRATTANRAALADIHLSMIRSGEARRARLVRQLDACERALAMRRFALDTLAGDAEASLRAVLGASERASGD